MFIYTRHSFTRSYSLIPVSICFCHFKSSRVSITNLHQRKKELNEACHSLAETVVYFSCEKLIFLACTNLLRKVLTDFSSCIGGTLTIYIIRHRTLKQSVYRLSHTCFFAGKQFSPNKVLFSPSLDENVCILLNNFLQAIRIKIMQQAS